jgi:hypothetical protein
MSMWQIHGVGIHVNYLLMWQEYTFVEVYFDISVESTKKYSN